LHGFPKENDRQAQVSLQGMSVDEARERSDAG
jgi:hypothetical protein